MWRRMFSSLKCNTSQLYRIPISAPKLTNAEEFIAFGKNNGCHIYIDVVKEPKQPKLSVKELNIYVLNN